MLNRALMKAKKDGGKKVAINFQVPVDLKEQFETLCKKNQVSLTSMLIGLMETSLEESEGIYFELTPTALLSMSNKISSLSSFIDDIEKAGLEHESDEIERAYKSAVSEHSRLQIIFNSIKEQK